MRKLSKTEITLEMSNELKTFFEHINSLDDVEMLMELHYKIKDYIEINDMQSVANLLKIYDNPQTDINILKIILLVTNPYNEVVEISDLWDSLLYRYDLIYDSL